MNNIMSWSVDEISFPYSISNDNFFTVEEKDDENPRRENGIREPIQPTGVVIGGNEAFDSNSNIAFCKEYLIPLSNAFRKMIKSELPIFLLPSSSSVEVCGISVPSLDVGNNIKVPVLHIELKRGLPCLAIAEEIYSKFHGLAVVDFREENNNTPFPDMEHSEKVQGRCGPAGGMFVMVDGYHFLRTGGTYKGHNLKLWRHDLNAVQEEEEVVVACNKKKTGNETTNKTKKKRWKYPEGFYVICVRYHTGLDEEKAKAKAEKAAETRRKKRKADQENPKEGLLRHRMKIYNDLFDHAKIGGILREEQRPIFVNKLSSAYLRICTEMIETSSP